MPVTGFALMVAGIASAPAMLADEPLIVTEAPWSVKTNCGVTHTGPLVSVPVMMALPTDRQVVPVPSLSRHAETRFVSVPVRGAPSSL